MTFAAFEEVRRVVLILIKGSRGNDCVFFDHGFIIARGSDIWGVIEPTLNNVLITLARAKKLLASNNF
jgi:hypothetical protein